MLIDVDAGNGLTFDINDALEVAAGGGITVDASGVSVDASLSVADFDGSLFGYEYHRRVVRQRRPAAVGQQQRSPHLAPGHRVVVDDRRRCARSRPERRQASAGVVAVGAAVPQLGNRTSTTYDDAGRATESENPENEVTTTVYDKANRVIVSVDPLGFRTTTTYDDAGRAVESENPENEVSTTVYDRANRTIATVDPLGRRTTTLYDDAGRTIE